MLETTLDQFLFQLPNQRLTREERIRLIKQVIRSEEEVTQESLDRLMARLLEEIQSDP